MARAESKQLVRRAFSAFISLKKILSFNEIFIRLFRLPRHDQLHQPPGLVLVQIDGLALRHLRKGIGKKHFPFLSSLLSTHDYRLYRQYSGVPSTTPAVQGELLYGVRQSVPSFQFRDRRTHSTFTMYYPESAAAVERELSQKSRGLLEGGSSYSNIFSGGAKETYFTVADFKHSFLKQFLHPYTVLVRMIFNIHVVFRVVLFIGIELMLAVTDFIRGVFRGYAIGKELKFVGTRVLFAAVLPEVITTMAQLDIRKGVPIIHINFLNYDEHSHRRGPSSGFAYWSMKGIDTSIKRLWKTARKGFRRDYDIWIYSDHGQEDTIPYSRLYGTDFPSAVDRVVRPRAGSSYHLNALGNFGELYASSMPAEEQIKTAKKLTGEGRIPLVIKKIHTAINAFTREGTYKLPADSGAVFGFRHPYLEEITRDIVELAGRQDEGTFLISGFRKDQPDITFAVERGSHGGPGYTETDGFCLVPSDVYLEHENKNNIRPADLRLAALKFLGRYQEQWFFNRQNIERIKNTIRVVTYNIHSSRGTDQILSPVRIARILARMNPDIVALQEVDSGCKQTDYTEQASLIARYLSMNHCFYPIIDRDEGRYGTAVLSRFPLSVVKTGRLPAYRKTAETEPRGIMWTTVDWNGMPVHVLNTHFGLTPLERKKQIEELLSIRWCDHSSCSGHVIITGDFNSVPRSYPYKQLRKRFIDVQTHPNIPAVRNTWHSRNPVLRIDHIFISNDLEPVTVYVPRGFVERVASDHLPVMAELKLKGV
ncbi:MAG: hypothetical protein GF384_03925 [Elusimicrobia bacterium]|nr:hypothetical protein [Elusimicrobiota bacterium]MBD3412042.1 hypothetical protein [Elusimicrobiota bacterium]